MTVPGSILEFAALAEADVYSATGSSADGLTAVDATRRLTTNGPNTVSAHRVTGWDVLGRQLRNPILVLLATTAIVSLALGDVTNSFVILGILLLSIGLGFITEFRAEKANELLHSRVTHSVRVWRDGHPVAVRVTELVVGDIVEIDLGTVIPADLRLIETTSLECDESIISGESFPVDKRVGVVPAGTALSDLSNSALMGTIVTAGSGRGVVVATGRSTEFGRIAESLGTHAPDTDFQKGLRSFSLFLLKVSLTLTSLIFIVNTLLQRPLLESIMFSLAIAIGMTPQLLPAVVSAALATGSRRMAAVGVLVKRLSSIEDLGDIDILVTDKTGTLTTGSVSFVRAHSLEGREALLTGLLATDTAYDRAVTDGDGLNTLDAALWSAVVPSLGQVAEYRRTGLIPFTHQSRFTAARVERDGTARIVVKGSAEDLASRCASFPATMTDELAAEYELGHRVVLVASAPTTSTADFTDADITGLTVDGFLVFTDDVKPTALESLAELNNLGIDVKIATGDNLIVARAVCSALGLPVSDILSGTDVDALSDNDLRTRAATASVFARVSPEQKARIIEALRAGGAAVGFMGDGVNDAIALHMADVGVSVDSAVDVAKDAADIVLLDKDLGVLARGVREGRRVFSNTMKYVLMGTSGDFGNMFSAAIGSVALNFLPMTPSQVLLNDVLYDSSQLAIPYDRVDPEAIARPSHWNIRLIRRFMMTFGPISSIFDAATFALMLFVFHAGQPEFQAGWFVESLATETLIVFVVRTRRVPFIRSVPSPALIASVLAVVAIGCYLPYSPFADFLGFVALPAPFFLALVGMVIAYLVLVELGKAVFFRRAFGDGRPATSATPRTAGHRLSKRSARFRQHGRR